MKLFVWVDPYPVYHGWSLVFAIAETEEAAREQARTGTGWVYGQYKDAAPTTMTLRAPRVVDLPCAEWHRWEA